LAKTDTREPKFRKKKLASDFKKGQMFKS